MCLKKIFRKRKQDDVIDLLLSAFCESHSSPKGRFTHEVVVFIDLPDGTRKERRTIHKTSEEAKTVLNNFKPCDYIKIDDNVTGIVSNSFLISKNYAEKR